MIAPACARMLIGKAAQVFLLHDHPRPEPCDSTCSFPNTDGWKAGRFPQMPQLSLTSSACRLVMLAHDAGSPPTSAVFPETTTAFSTLRKHHHGTVLTCKDQTMVLVQTGRAKRSGVPSDKMRSWRRLPKEGGR